MTQQPIEKLIEDNQRLTAENASLRADNRMLRDTAQTEREYRDCATQIAAAAVATLVNPGATVSWLPGNSIGLVAATIGLDAARNIMDARYKEEKTA